MRLHVCCVRALQACVEGLTHDNEELRHKLELQTQRLELQMQGMHSGQAAVSLHQVSLGFCFLRN